MGSGKEFQANHAWSQGDELKLLTSAEAQRPGCSGRPGYPGRTCPHRQRAVCAVCHLSRGEATVFPRPEDRGLTGCVAEGQSTGQPWRQGSTQALNPQPHRRYCKPAAHKEPDVTCGPRAVLANMPRVLATEGYSGSALCPVQQATLQSSRPLKTQQSAPSAGPEWRETSDDWTKPSV